MAASTPAGSSPWPPAVVEFVREEQEEAYRLLAVELGFGPDPAKAFARMNPDLPPGVDPGPFPPDVVRQLYDRYAATVPPSPYETRINAMTMAMVIDQVRDAFADSIGSPPFLATIPSGEVNARIVREPETGVPVILFEQGMFRFLMDMAKLIAWAVPPLSAALLADDDAIIGLPHIYTMPFQASPSWSGSLYAYVTSGSPIVDSPPIPTPGHNRYVAAVVLGEMEKFVMAHELSHLALGHLDRPARDVRESWEQEHEADVRALAVLGEQALRKGYGWTLCLWGCDLALICFDVLDRALAQMAFGPTRPRWKSPTHPAPHTRRFLLRDRVREVSPGASPSAIKAAQSLLGMTDSLLPHIYDLGSLPLKFGHWQGVRPSPLWAAHIARSFAPDDSQDQGKGG
jgi:hypothetical protein